MINIGLIYLILNLLDVIYITFINTGNWRIYSDERDALVEI